MRFARRVAFSPRLFNELRIRRAVARAGSQAFEPQRTIGLDSGLRRNDKGMLPLAHFQIAYWQIQIQLPPRHTVSSNKPGV